MSNLPCTPVAPPLPVKKPRKPRKQTPTVFVNCESCGTQISKGRYANHRLTLSCAVRTYNNRCAEMMRKRGYVPIETYEDAKIWRLLPEDFREMGPSPRGSASMKTEVCIWVKEELGAVINGALRARLDDKLLFRIAHVASTDAELRAAMATLFLMSPREAFVHPHYSYPGTKVSPQPERDALIDGLAQWVGDWENAQIPDMPTD